jgi:hypothetical protein
MARSFKRLIGGLLGMGAPTTEAASFFALSAQTGEGVALDFSTLRGKVVLVANVASQ